jgi:hypothetical protein
MRLGVLGTLVWDRIDHPGSRPVERWGGIAYSLAAAAAALPAGWTVRPIIKVGRDLSRRAAAFLDGLPGLERPGGAVETAEPNNRVHLRYRDRHHRDEHLTGGVPGWRWQELAPLLAGLDALYVNLISGFELGSDVAGRLRGAVAGPVYADLHSLLLGVAPGGRRVPRRLPDRDAWLAAFHLVQVNEAELGWLAEDEEPWAFAARAVAAGLPAILVTRGPAGATALAARTGPRPWEPPAGPVHTLDAPLDGVGGAGDPTGCGDVWGATCFVALVRGQPLASALAAANRAAARNAEHRGADGLHTFLMEAT